MYQSDAACSSHTGLWWPGINKSQGRKKDDVLQKFFYKILCNIIDKLGLIRLTMLEPNAKAKPTTL